MEIHQNLQSLLNFSLKKYGEIISVNCTQDTYNTSKLNMKFISRRQTRLHKALILCLYDQSGVYYVFLCHINNLYSLITVLFVPHWRLLVIIY